MLYKNLPKCQKDDVSIFLTNEKGHCRGNFILSFFYRTATKYCPLLQKEGGLDILKEMRVNSRTSEQVKRLINSTLDLARRYENAKVTMVSASDVLDV